MARNYLVMLPSCLVKCAQSLGQLVLQRLASRRALWPADARDAPLLPRQMRAVTRAVGFATPGVQEGPVARNIPADARDAPLLPRQMGSWFCNAWRAGGPCGQKYTQLMLVMLPSCLVKCVQEGPVARNIPS